jgi:hypothetical protein
VEKERIARIHFAMNQLMPFDGLCDTIRISTFLVARGEMFNSTDMVRTAENL